ncbi:MAG: RNA polymerase sigma factor [Raoultibacter sp.]
MRSGSDMEAAIDTHGNTVWRVCTLAIKSYADAQDAFQEVFLKYALNETPFKDEEHRKAWLIRVAVNTCKDMLRAAHRKNVSLDEGLENGVEPLAQAQEGFGSATQEVLDAMDALGDPPKTPIYLALYEGYSAPEIATMLDAPVNTVYSWIARGKQQLKEALA